MGLTNKIENIKLPNSRDMMQEIVSSKQKMKSLQMNKITVNYIYDNGRFKHKVIGEISRIIEIPIIFFSIGKDNLACLLDSNSIITDSETKEQEIFLNENCLKAISFSKDILLNENTKVKDWMKKYLNDIKLLIPFSYNDLNFDTINYELIIDDIKISPMMLCSLGSQKLIDEMNTVNTTGYLLIAIVFFLLGGMVFTFINMWLFMGT